MLNFGDENRFHPWKNILQINQNIATTIDGRIIQTLVIQYIPAPPITMLFFWFGSLLRMDEINQTLRSGTKIRNHNIEIWGDRGQPTTHGCGVWIICPSTVVHSFQDTGSVFPNPAGFGVLFLQMQRSPRKRHQTRLWMEQGSEKGGGKAALLLMIFTAVSFERIADTSGNYDQTLQKKTI